MTLTLPPRSPFVVAAVQSRLAGGRTRSRAVQVGNAGGGCSGHCIRAVCRKHKPGKPVHSARSAQTKRRLTRRVEDLGAHGRRGNDCEEKRPERAREDHGRGMVRVRWVGVGRELFGGMGRVMRAIEPSQFRCLRWTIPRPAESAAVLLACRH